MNGMIENHKKAAHHLEEAARYHHEAIVYHQTGNQDKALICTVKAQGHTIRATQCQKEFLLYQASIQ